MAIDAAVDRFARDVRGFSLWLLNGRSDGPEAARDALHWLLRLYVGALRLPPHFSPDVINAPEAEPVSDDDWQRAYVAAARLPFESYSDTFDPTAVPPHEPAVGQIADDVADIYRDLTRGLRAYDSGQRETALWEWGFNFRDHWGAHATAAIRALHWWLANNAGDYLFSTVSPTEG